MTSLPIKLLYLGPAIGSGLAVKEALAADERLHLVDTVETGRALLARLAVGGIWLVVVDPNIEDMAPAVLLDELRGAHRSVKTIFISDNLDRETDLGGLLFAGATRCLLRAPNTGDAVWSSRLRRACLRAGGLSPTDACAAPVSPTDKDPARRTDSVPLSPHRESTAPVNVLVIGSSTGGPAALGEVLSGLPGDLHVPVVVVQHMPDEFTWRLAKQLNGRCGLEVVEAQDDMPIERGRVYIAPGDRHVKLQRRGLHTKAFLDDGPLVNSCRPSVDITFSSAARQFGSGVLAAVLTGMGNDGLDGAKKIVESGGTVFVQDRETSVVWGMPGYIAKAGLAARTLPIDQIAPTLVRRCNDGELRRRGTG